MGRSLKLREGSYDKHFDLNVRSLIELTKSLAPRMVKAGWGRIINIGSCLGEAAPVLCPWRGTMYVATKFAAQEFTRALSRELGSTGVTVNDVQPGAIDTELSPDDDGPAAQMTKKIMSVGRFGRVEEIASAVSFIANPESAFIMAKASQWMAAGTHECRAVRFGVQHRKHSIAPGLANADLSASW